MRRVQLALVLIFAFNFCNGQKFIVRFNGYFDELKRLEILKQASLVSVEKRGTEFSDFEVVQGNVVNFRHPLIRDIHQCSNSSALKLAAKNLVQRRRPGYDILNIPQKIYADRLWTHGFTGNGIKVAIFDTGLTSNRAHFRSIVVERDYTDESLPSDQVGHGTFVAGVIAGSNRRCPGVAPNAELYIYKVFTKNQESKTKWFLDAFNDAIQHKVDIINLSIGGTDYMDKLFMEKVEEIIARGIIFVSAVGNDGPIFGSISNPADHLAVIGVGAINSALRLATFSSRGITTSEFPDGYGRVKPDIVTFGVQLRAAAKNGGCRFMSGTSVAAPLITGSIALLLSSIPVEQRNSMRIHQALHLGAERLDRLSIVEQGAGRFELLNSFAALRSEKPQITLFPSYLDMTDSDYMWPYFSQPLYTSGMPLILNISVHSGFNSSALIKKIKFEHNGDENGEMIDISVEQSREIDRSGYLALFISANKLAASFNGLIEGQLNVEFELRHQNASVQFPIRLNVIPIPSKNKRILWDQFRNLYYPFGFVPRDDLRSNKTPLDWHIDHPHTNFNHLYNKLRENGFFVEMSGRPLTCTDLSNYGTLLIVDPEDEFFPHELTQIENAVKNGSNLIAVGDWYNELLLENIKFEDPSSTQQLRYPETGGSNLPALNELIGRFGFALGDQVLDGTVNLFNREVRIASGAQLRAAPSTAWIASGSCNNIVSEAINKTKTLVENAAIFGLTRPTTESGFVAVFGDSNCFQTNECGSILVELLNLNNNDFTRFGLKRSDLKQLPLNGLPTRLTKSNFAAISRVAIKVYKTYVTYKLLPDCFAKELIDVVISDQKIGFNHTDKLEQLRTIARQYFNKSSTIQPGILSNQNDPNLDYFEYDVETRAKNILQYYTYRFLYFISFVVLISFLWFTLIPRHRIKNVLLRPLVRLLGAFT